MSYSYESSTRRSRALTSNRTALGYWLPLGVTATAAVIGLAAWAWKEHRDSESEEYLDYSDNAEYARRLRKERDDLSQHGPPGSEGPPGSYPGYSDLSTTQETEIRRAEFDEQGIAIEDVEEQEGFVAQMRGAIRRTPSPQKLYEGAREKVAAGFQAVGKGLTSITEEKGDDYVDHERWSEEADSKDQEERESTSLTTGLATGAAITSGTAALERSSDRTSTRDTTIRTAPSAPSQPLTRGRKRMIAVVVSAAQDPSYAPSDSTHELSHASLLSHMLGHTIPSTIDLVILIYAPSLQSHPLSSTNKPPRRRSSDSNPLNTPTEDDIDDEGAIISQYSTAASDPSPLYTALTRQAASLVSHPTSILPFTSPTGHIHILKHLAPNLVYMQESLCGERGELLGQVEGWVGSVIVLVGSEGAGLVDTETEDEGEKGERSEQGDQREQREHGEQNQQNQQGKGKKEKWWMRDERVGFGKGVEVVEGMRLGEDWEKRVGAR